MVESLGFKPTIRDIFRIICNNTQAMLSTIHSISSQAPKTQDKQAYRINKLQTGTGGLLTDIPADTKKAYAWPSVYRVTR